MEIELYRTRTVLLEKSTLHSRRNSYIISLLDGCVLRSSYRYTNSVFFLKNDNILFELDSLNQRFIISCDHVYTKKGYCMPSGTRGRMKVDGYGWYVSTPNNFETKLEFLKKEEDYMPTKNAHRIEMIKKWFNNRKY
jgi:hypothetical protein